VCAEAVVHALMFYTIFSI